MFKIFRYFFIKFLIIPLNKNYLNDPYYQKFNKKDKIKTFNFILNKIKTFSDILNINIKNEIKTNFFIFKYNQSILEKKIYTKYLYFFIIKIINKKTIKIINFIGIQIFKFYNYNKFLYTKNLIKENKNIYNKLFYKTIKEKENIKYIKKYYFILYIFRIYQLIPNFKNIFLFSFKKQYNFNNIKTIKNYYYIPIQNFKNTKYINIKNKYIEYLYIQSQRNLNEIIQDKVLKNFYIRFSILIILIIYFIFFFNTQIIYEKFWKIYLKEPTLNIIYNLLPNIPIIYKYFPDWITQNYIIDLYKKLILIKFSFINLKFKFFFYSLYIIFETDIRIITEIINTYFLLNINLLNIIEKYLNFQINLFENLPINQSKIIIIIILTILICYYYIKLLIIINNFINLNFYKIKHKIILYTYTKNKYFNTIWKLILINLFYIFGLIYPTYRNFKIFFLPNSLMFKNLLEILNKIIYILIIFKTYIFKLYWIKNFYNFFIKIFLLKFFKIIIKIFIYINFIYFLYLFYNLYFIYLNIYKFYFLIELYNKINILTNIYFYYFQIYKFYFNILICIYIIISIFEFKKSYFKFSTIKKFLLFTILFWILIPIPYYNIYLINLILTKYILYPIIIKLFNFIFKEFASIKNFNLIYILFNWNLLFFFTINTIFIIIYIIIKNLNFSILLNIIFFFLLLINFIIIQIQIKLINELNIYFTILKQQKILIIKSKTIYKKSKNNNSLIYLLFLILHLYYYINLYLNKLIIFIIF